MFKSVSVKQKIYVLAFLGVCISSFITVESILAMREIGNKIEQITLQDIPLTNKVTETTIHQLEQAIQLERAIKYAEMMDHDYKAQKGFKKAVKAFKKYAHIVDNELIEAENMVAHVLDVESDQVIVDEFTHVGGILQQIKREHKVFDKHAYEVFDLLARGHLAQAETLAYKIEDEVKMLDKHLADLLVELETFTNNAALNAVDVKQHMEKILVIVSVGGVILFIVLSYFIARGIISSLVGTQLYAKALSEGNLDSVAPVHYFNDEVAAVISALDVLKGEAVEAKNLRQDQARLKDEADKEKRSVMLDLADRFETQVSDSIVSLSDASEQIQRTSVNMKDITNTTVDFSATVGRSSQESSENVSTVASAMEEMSASSSEISSQIMLVKNKSNQAAESARDANGTVNNLSELVSNIGEVVSAIQGIAEQTNLLALNATIEAARAGDAGRGFAVVADEVKKLATETSVKTQEINDRITGIKDATQATVSSMDTIIKNITDIDGSVTSVSAAVEEQNVTTNEIVRSVSDASQGVQEVSSIIIDVEKGLTEVGGSADNVLKSSETAIALSRDLKLSFAEFLSDIRSDNQV